MNTKLKKQILLNIIVKTIVLITSTFALAEESPLSLDQAISEALSQSPIVQKSRSMAEESRWKKNEVLGEGFLPKLSVSATHYVESKYQLFNFTTPTLAGSFPEVYPQTLLETDLTVPLFDGFASTMKLQAASRQRAAAEKELEFTEFQIQETVQLAFYEALGAQLISDVYEQNVKTLEDHLRLTQLLFNNGAATNYDILRVEVQLNEAKSDALEAKDNVELTRQKLAQVMGRAVDDRKLVGNLPVPKSETVTAIQLDHEATQRADLQALDLRASAAEKMATSSSLYLVPKISLIGNYQYYNNINFSVDQSSLFRNAYGLGFMAQWNLFDGAVSIARAREAAEQRYQAEKTVQQARLELPYDFNQWKKKYLNSADRFQVKTLDVEKSKESVRLAREEQKAGSRTSSEVLDAELDLFRAKAGVVNAQLNSAQALIHLELAMGRRL